MTFKVMENQLEMEFDMFTLSEAEQARLSKRLNDIEEADPLNYRRLALAESSGSGPQIFSVQDLKSIAQLQNVLYEPTFTSHRKIVGPIVVLAKRIIYRFLKKWFGILSARQFELNQRVFNLAMTVHILENRVKSLEDRGRN